MTTNVLKTKLTKAIAGIDDKSFLEALYTIVHNKMEPFDYKLTEEDLAIIEQRQSDYKAGKIKGMSMGEVRKKVMKKLSV